MMPAPATLAPAIALTPGLPLLELLRRILATTPVNIPALDVLIDCTEDAARRAEAEADAATFHTAEQRAERGSRSFHKHRAFGYWQTARLARSARMIFADQPEQAVPASLPPSLARQLLRLYPASSAELILVRAGVPQTNPALRLLDALITAAELEERGA